MKRFIFSAIALVVAATACTESGLIDMPEFYGNSIVFSTYIGKTPVTKAENADLSYLEKEVDNGGGAHVLAYMCDKGNRNSANVDFSSIYMDGRIICTTPTTTTVPGTWKYQEYISSAWSDAEAYWPGEKDLAFAAYNLKAAGKVGNVPYMTNISTDKTQFDFTVSNAVSSQVDLLVTPLTFVSETPNNDTQVSLNFYHLLSRIGFKVQATDDTSAKIEIQSIKLNGSFPKSGHVDLKLATKYASSIVTPVITPITEGSNAYTQAYNLFGSNESFSILSSECFTGPSENRVAAPKPIYNNSSVTESTEDDVVAALESNRFMMIMPGKQPNASIEISYKLTGESSYRYANINLGSDWEFKAGYAYEFILKISTAAIEFEAQIGQNWGSTGTNGDTNIPQGN